MSPLMINPNKARDPRKEEAASLERDLAAIHHNDGDARNLEPLEAALPAALHSAPAPVDTQQSGIDNVQWFPGEPRAVPPLPPVTQMPPSTAVGNTLVQPAPLPECGTSETAMQSLEETAETPVGNDKKQLHPLVAALMKSVPPGGAPWPAAHRAAWFSAAEGIFHITNRATGRVWVGFDPDAK